MTSDMGRRVRFLREQWGLSVNDVATIADVNPRRLAEIEDGSGFPTTYECSTLEEVLPGCGPRELGLLAYGAGYRGIPNSDVSLDFASGVAPPVVTNPLLRPPTSSETALLEEVYDAYVTHHEWPRFQYVDHALYEKHHLNAADVLNGCPRITIQPAGIGHYGWLRLSGVTLTAPQDSDTLSLTIAGMSRIQRAGGTTIRLFLAVVGYLVAVQQAT